MNTENTKWISNRKAHNIWAKSNKAGLSYTDSLCRSVSKESACSAGDLGSIPQSGRSPGEGNGNPLQYPCLENRLDRGAWWAAVLGVTESSTTKQLTLHFTSVKEHSRERSVNWNMKIVTETRGARRPFILQISTGRTAFPSPPFSLIIVTLRTQNIQFNDDVLCEKNYTQKTKRMK